MALPAQSATRHASSPRPPRPLLFYVRADQAGPPGEVAGRGTGVSGRAGRASTSGEVAGRGHASTVHTHLHLPPTPPFLSLRSVEQGPVEEQLSITASRAPPLSRSPASSSSCNSATAVPSRRPSSAHSPVPSIGAQPRPLKLARVSAVYGPMPRWPMADVLEAASVHSGSKHVRVDSGRFLGHRCSLISPIWLLHDPLQDPSAGSRLSCGREGSVLHDGHQCRPYGTPMPTVTACTNTNAGRAEHRCCEKVGLKRGRWTAEKDHILFRLLL